MTAGTEGPSGLVQRVESARDQAKVYLAGRDMYIVEERGEPLLIPPPGSRAAAILRDLMVGFEVPSLMVGLVARTRRHRWVSVTGSAGGGKSCLISALVCPNLCLGLVPDGFVQALIYCDGTTTEESLGLEIRDQLLASVASYPEALARHYDDAEEGWADQPALTRYVSGPLALLASNEGDTAEQPPLVRILIDGADQIGPESVGAIVAGLARLADDDGPPGLRLVLAHRDDLAGLPEKRATIAVDVASAPVLERYLQAQTVPPTGAHELATLCVRAGSAWLAARLIADTYGQLDTGQRRELHRLISDSAGRKNAINWLYQRRMDEVPGWNAPISSRGEGSSLRAVLTALAATGSGPVAPLPLLVAVADQFGTSMNLEQVRSLLDDLGRLVIRIFPESDRELVGLYHVTLTAYLADRDRPGAYLDVNSGRRLLLEEIDRLAPVSDQYVDNPLYRWATSAAPEHYWRFDMPEAAFKALERRPLPVPRQNLDRWAEWYPRFRQRLGPDHGLVFRVQGAVAHWTGEAGNPSEALRLLKRLLAERERVQGRKSGGVLATRLNIAMWTGRGGDPAGALRQMQALLPEQERLFGADDRGTLTSRANIAALTGEVGDAQAALALHRAVLPEQKRVLGPFHPGTLKTRAHIANWTGETGAAADAVRLLERLVPDLQRALGPQDLATLSARANLASWIGEAGDPVEALRLLHLLLSDEEEALGADHPNLLVTQANIARLMYVTGDRSEGVRRLRRLAAEEQRIHGREHPQTRKVQADLAMFLRRDRKQ